MPAPPNCWLSPGFEALATTSLGMANALGRADGEGAVSRAELLENCRIIAEATDLPINADLENGYADDPKEAASILRDAAEMGVVGGWIEDWSGERIYDFNHAVERVAAGVEVAHSLPVRLPSSPGRRTGSAAGSASTIDQAPARFGKGRCRVLLRPGYATWRRCARSCSRSEAVNMVMSAADPALTAAEMEAVGVKRLSVGGALSRLALAAFMNGAREMRERGGFTWVREATPTNDLKAVFRA